MPGIGGQIGRLQTGDLLHLRFRARRIDLLDPAAMRTGAIAFAPEVPVTATISLPPAWPASATSPPATAWSAAPRGRIDFWDAVVVGGVERAVAAVAD